MPVSDYGIWSPLATDIFTKDWLDYTSGLGLNFHRALLFYRGPNTTSREAHVDTRGSTYNFVNFALNWVIGGEGSKMNWYDMPKDPAVATTVKDPKTQVPYTTFQFKDLEYIESCEIKNEVTLVRTNVPHSITMGNEPRWCISARVNRYRDQSWDKVVEKMRSSNLLVERHD
jgi:hypothetical protein